MDLIPTILEMRAYRAALHAVERAEQSEDYDLEVNDMTELVQEIRAELAKEYLRGR